MIDVNRTSLTQMELLFLVPISPYPTISGGRLDCYGQIIAAAAAGHKVTVLGKCKTEEEGRLCESHLHRKSVKSISFKGKRSLYKLLQPFSPYLVEAAAMKRNSIAGTLRPFLEARRRDLDLLVIIENAQAFGLYEQIRPLIGPHLTVLRAQNCEAQYFREMARAEKRNILLKFGYYYESARFKRFERAIFRRKLFVWPISKLDEAILTKEYTCNCLFRLLRPVVAGKAELLACDQEEHVVNVPADLCGNTIIGTIASFAGGFNVDGVSWFLDKCMPALSKSLPNLVFLIVGIDSKNYFKHSDKVRVYDNVDSLEPFFEKIEVFLVLSFNCAGVKMKLIEAVERNLRVVSTTCGVAGSGLESVVPNSDDPSIFIEYIRNALAGDYPKQELMRRFRQVYDPRLAFSEALHWVQSQEIKAS